MSSKTKLPKIECKSFTKLVKLKDLKPYPENENTHDKQQIELIFAHIKDVGIRKPIIVSKQSGFIVTGHGTRRALLLFGDENLEVPVEVQSFKSDLEEMRHRVADNELAKLSKINQSVLETNISNLNISFESFDFTGVGLIDFVSLEDQADLLLDDADDEEDEDEKQLGDDLAPAKSSQSKKKQTVEIEREVSPGAKVSKGADIPAPSDCKNISPRENLSDYKISNINIFDARLTSWQVRAREWGKVFSAHTPCGVGSDFVLLETLANLYAPNGAKASLFLDDSCDEFYEIVGLNKSDKELNYFCESLMVLNETCGVARVAEKFERLENDSFFTIILANGFRDVFLLDDEIKKGLLNDSATYIPSKFEGEDFIESELAPLSVPVLTFVKGSITKAYEKVALDKKRLKKQDQILKEFYNSVINESDF